MCYFQGRSAGEYCSCCQKCKDYLSVCVPIVINGYVAAECDFVFCRYCPHYAVCEDLWGKEMKGYEVVEL